MCAAAIAGLSGLALIGWAADVHLLNRMAPGLPPIKANAALCLLAISIGLIAYSYSAQRSRLRRVGAACAVFSVAVGATTLAEYVLGNRLGLDELLFSDQVSAGSPYPGRPSVNAAVGIVLLGTGLLTWDVRLGRWWVTNLLAWVTALVGLMALAGYATGVNALVAFEGRQQIALNAAASLCVLPLAFVLARPGRGGAAILAGDGHGGLMLRRLLPAAIVLPLALAALTLTGQRSRLFSIGFGIWLFATAMTVILVAVVWLVAAASERAGRQRSQLETMMLALTNCASDAIVTADASGRVLYANAALGAMFGYDPSGLLGRPGEILFPARDRSEQLAWRARLFATRDPNALGQVGEALGVRADGSEFPIEISRAGWVANGEPVVAAIIRDVSDRRRAQEATARLAAIVESSDDAIIGKTIDGEITSWNRAAERIYGYSAAEAIGEHISMLAPLGQEDDTIRLLARVAAGERVSHLETVRRRKDGRLIDVSMTVSPIRDADGGVTGASSVARDITEHKRSERELQRLAAAAEHGTDAVISIDLEQRVCHWNRGAELLYGFTAEEAIGRTLAELTVFTDEPSDQIARLEAGDPAFQYETRRRRKDGTVIDVLLTVSPWTVDGELLGVTGIAIDLSERKQAERAREQALRDLEEAQRLARIGSWTWDSCTDHVTWSSQMFDVHGRDRMLGPASRADAFAYVHPDDRARVSAALSVTFNGGPGFELDHRIIAADGTERTVHVLGHQDPARPGFYLGTFQDVTEQRAAERALKDASERFRRAFDEAPIGMAVVSADGHVEQANAALASICGYTRAELAGRYLRELLHPADSDTGGSALRALARGEIEQLALDLRVIPAAGSAVDVSVHATRLGTALGPSDRLLCQFLDVTDRKRFEAQLQFMADHDPLTGLLNRRKFEAELDRHVAHVTRYGPEGAVLVLDIDHFKTVNDTLGHNAGDQLIASIAGILRHRLRASDTLARLGGDEFAVLLPRADRVEAEQVAEAIVRAVRNNASLLGGERKKVTTSLGIAMFSAGTEQLSGETILIEADLAMYDAKEAGRDCWAFYETSEHRVSRTESRLTWSNRIERALENDGFMLVAQPILDLHTEQVRQYELLLRMLDEHDDLIPPAAFLYIAERFGSISRIDQWVASAAIDLIAEHPELHLEINISGKSLGDQALLQAIDDRLRSSRIDPTHLIFEVTETAAVANVTHAQAFAQHLRDRGCRFALDDFGAGFGSFYYLKHLPFDYVKIDGEFVKHVTSGQIDQLVIEAVVRIAQGLGKETIAEFVANEQTKRMVRRLGVDHAQGYYVGKPVPLPEILEVELPR